ncbi:MAG: immune inhibitor A domain-containing protein [Dermatophilaceae bacterium]
MRRTVVWLLGLVLATSAGVGMSSTSAVAGPPVGGGPQAATAERAGADDLPHPLEEKRRAMREAGLTSVLNGTATAETVNGSQVVNVGNSSVPAEATGSAPSARPAAGTRRDQYVELQRDQTDRIFVILAEFGDERDAEYPDQDTDPEIAGPALFDGPLRNQIPEPDRAVDNSTVWQPDYDRQHFQDLYFGADESLREYYEKQSSGRYSVDGTVTDWVKVTYNQARYGRSDGFPCPDKVCDNAWDLVRDAANQWVTDQRAAGRSSAEVAAEMKSFDQWDRYDFDADGNFNESDGYIDHFQIVHSGRDQADQSDEDPTPEFGEDAIWSHRWYAYGTDIGSTGPATNPVGGTEIGDTGIWIGDYTIQPENGGRSVFYHEYAHDLGLPDDYNTGSGCTPDPVVGGCDNSNEFWTLMAQNRLSAKDDEAIGERGGDLGAWNKLQLGWLDYETVVAGQQRTLDLGPQEYNSAKPQAAVVVLPKKKVTTELGAPAGGEGQVYSGSGDSYEGTLESEVTVPEGSPALTFRTRYDIEEDYDFGFVEVDDGSGFVAVAGSITEGPDNEIDGTQGDWADASFDMSAYAGQTVTVRFRYVTDGGSAGNDAEVVDGWFIDDIAIGDFAEDAESGTDGWTASGFSVVGSSVTTEHDNFYIAGHRSYVSYDKYLKTGPYFMGHTTTRPDFVDHFPYQEGLLISYWDTSYADNDTFAHPGNGLNLVIDSRPTPKYNLTGAPWRSRVQVYDAPFSMKKADSFTLNVNSQPSFVRGEPAQPLFDDTKKYWFEELPNHGVKLPAVGVKIRVVEQKGTSMRIRIS